MTSAWMSMNYKFFLQRVRTASLDDYGIRSWCADVSLTLREFVLLAREIKGRAEDEFYSQKRMRVD